MYEESLRMSLVVRYPREIPAGSTNGDLILNLDLPETFLNYAGAPLPGHMPGRRARAALAGQAPADWRTSMYYRYWMHEMRPAHYGIRTGHYKLIFFYGKDVLGQTRAPATRAGWELYDMEPYPYDTHNVYHDPAYAEVVSELKTELNRLRSEIGATDANYPELVAL